MNKKDVIISILILIVLINVKSIKGTLVGHYTFQTEEGNPATEVNAIWYACANSDCTQVKSNPTANLFSPNPKNLGTSNKLDVIYPNCMETTYGYIIYTYKQGYKSKLYLDNDNTSISYSCYYSYYDPWYDYTPANKPSLTIFVKKDQCVAEFTPSISSCTEAGLPLSILTDTKLDSNTISAFNTNFNFFFPSELYPWRNVTTRMLINIKKQGSPNSISGYPQSQQYGIYSGTSHPFSFLWQTSKNTEPGDYQITMTSTVPDEKCDQSNMVPTTQTMNVHIARSLDTCIADLNLTAKITNMISLTGDPIVAITFNGSHLNSYQDWNYSTVSSCNAGDAQLLGGKIFGANYRYTITNNSNGREILSGSGTLPSNDNYYTAKPFLIKSSAIPSGEFIINFTITSAGDISVCGGEGITGSRIITLVNGHDNDGDSYYDNNGDCNDNNPNIHPGAIEICNGIDDNCNSQIDENGVCSQITYYCDNDQDGLYSLTPTGTCTGANCYTQGCQLTAGTDCDDTNSTIKAQVAYYRDLDRDGYGNPAVSLTRCAQNRPADYVLNNTDCNEDNANINPGKPEICTDSAALDENCNGLANCYDTASCPPSIWQDIFNPCTCTKSNSGAEICDGLDNNCNGQIDENCDKDKDRYADYIMICTGNFTTTSGNASTALISRSCSLYGGSNGDCNDNDPTIYPGAIETCDGIDNNCDPMGRLDEGCDKDSDGFAEKAMQCKGSFLTGNKSLLHSCTEFGNEKGDCNDQDSSTYPGALENCDGIDHNCDGKTNIGCACKEAETKQCGLSNQGVCKYGIQECVNSQWGDCLGAVNPGQEICGDGLDNDCNGGIDNLPECCTSGTKDCIKDSCPGKMTCVDNKWSGCVAGCTGPITILSPVKEKIYSICGKDTSITIDYKAEGKCQYKFDGKKSFADAISGLRVRVSRGDRTLTLRCGNNEQAVSFYIKEAKECTIINMSVDNDTSDIFIDEGFTEEEIINANNTAKEITQTLEYSESESGTTITNIIDPKKNMKDFNYSLYIPKCLAEYLGEIEFSNTNFNIIKEDPLIAWHFTDVSEKIDLSYKIKKKVDPECLKKIKGLPIASLFDIGSSDGGLIKTLLPGIIIAIIAGLAIYIQKVHPVQGNNLIENNDSKIIEKQRERFLENFRSWGLKKEEALKYMKEKGFTEDDMKWFMKRL